MEKSKRDKIFFSAPFAAYGGNEPYIFVSYSHLDINRVYPEIVRLHNKGFRIWYDEGVEPTAKFTSQVTKAIMNSSLFIVFISQDSVESSHVEREIRFAIDNKIKVLPLFLEDTKLPNEMAYLLSTSQGIMKYNMLPEVYTRKLEDTLQKELIAARFEKLNEKTKTKEHPFGLDKSKKHYKYHVFISFRDFDEDGDLTPDSAIAHKVSKFLSGKKLNISPNIISLEKLGVAKSGETLEENINSSQIMVVVAMSPENINCQKAKHEWTRFLNRIILDGVNSDRLLVSYIKGFDPSELPDALKKSEVILHGTNSLDRLYNLITSMPGIEEKLPGEELELRKRIEKGQELCLLRTKGEGPDKVTIFLGDDLTVGRRNDNDIVLDTNYVSRRHAKIIYNKEGFFVEDLKSKNGTFVNNERLEKKKGLRPGDLVRFDTVAYKVWIPSNDKNVGIV